MKRRFWGGLIMLVIVMMGALSPVLGFFVSDMQPKVAYAQSTGSPTTPPTAPNNTTAIECGTNFICGGVVLYSEYVLFLPKLLVTLGGLVLDYALWNTIQSSTYTTQDQANSFVVTGWKLVRDFSNLIFIFALFAVGFSLILSSAGSEERPLFGLDPKRTIVRVIIIALLVNFSFFMCRVIIDVTNVIAQTFYHEISAGAPSSFTNTSGGSVANFYTTNNWAGIESVSLAILNKINPQQLVINQSNIQQTNNGSFSSLAGWKSYDMGTYVLILFTATLSGLFDFFLLYIFVSSSIFLFIRTVGLFFLIILSPIAFVSTTIPQLQNKEYFGFDDWFKQLTGLAFTAPVYLFFLYITIIFLSPINSTGSTIQSNNLALAGVLVVKLATAGAVLIFGKKVTKDLSGKIGAMASQAVDNIVIGGAMVAGAAYMGGAGGVFQMGKRAVTQTAKSAAIGIGNNTIGTERTDELRKRWGQVKKFNPNAIRKVITAGPAPEPGSLIATARGAFTAFRQGEVGNRYADFQAAKMADAKAKVAKAEADKEKTKKIDKEIDNLKKEKEAGEITAKEYAEQLKGLALERKLILNPAKEEQEAFDKAKKAAEEAEKERKEKEPGLDQNIATANAAATAKDKTIAENTKKMSDAATKIANALADQRTAGSTITTKDTQIEKEKETFTKESNTIEQEKNSLEEQKKQVDKELADTDQQLAAEPKTGFGVNHQKIDELNQKRQGAMNQQQSINNSLGKNQERMTTLSSNHSSTLAGLERERKEALAKQQLAIDAEKEATRQQLESEAAKKKAEAEKKGFEDAASRLAASKQALTDAVVSTSAVMKKATDELNRRKAFESAKDRRNNRRLAPKTDTENRARNDDKINVLNEYLKNIANGGKPNSAQEKETLSKEFLDGKYGGGTTGTKGDEKAFL